MRTRPPVPSMSLAQPAELRFFGDVRGALLTEGTERSLASAVGPPRRRARHVVHFDTPRRELAREGLMLSVKSQAGLHRQVLERVLIAGGVAVPQGRIEWPLTGAHPNSRLVISTPEGAPFAIDPDALLPIMEGRLRLTDQIVESAGGARLLLRLQTGWLTSVSLSGEVRRQAVEELLLRMLSGDPRFLFDWAQALAERVAVRLVAHGPEWRALHEAGARQGTPPRREDAVTPVQIGHGGQIPGQGAPLTVPLKTPLKALAAVPHLALHAQAAWAGVLEAAFEFQTGKGKGSGEDEALHQARVLLRRLALLAGWLGRARRDPACVELARAVRGCYQRLGGARDWSVFGARLAALESGDAKPRAAALWVAAATRRRAAETDAARAALAGPAFQALMLHVALRAAQGLGEPVSPESGRSLGWLVTRLNRRIARGEVRLQHALPGLASHSGKSRHRARQVARQLQDEARLLLEVAKARRVRARAAALARLQEALGRQNDWTCARRLARTLECPDLGALEDWLRARQRHALATACRAANRYRRLPRYSS